MKKLIFCWLIFCAVSLHAAEVLTWVPAYSRSESYTMLNKDFGGVGMKDGLSRLALQFWRPTPAGMLELDSAFGTITNANIRQFTEWGQANNVKILLCIYNPPANAGEPWEWSRAQAAFRNKEIFVDAIVKEIDRLDSAGINIAGVDMDLESSTEASDQDKADYIKMMKLLSQTLRSKGKILSAATYGSKWNAPNIDYWPELIPYLDGITPMAYETAGYDVTCDPMWNHPENWCTYAGFIAAANGFDKTKLTIGMPGNLYYGDLAGTWMGKTNIEHIQGAKALGSGVSIWDSYLHSSWQNAQVWKLLKDIKHGGGSFSSSSSALSSSLPTSSSSSAGSSSSVSSSADGNACTKLETWRAENAYFGGTEVKHNAQRYQAKWWTRGDDPSRSGEWGVWKNVGNCGGSSSSSSSRSSSSSISSSSSYSSSTNSSGGKACLGIPVFSAGANYGVGSEVQSKGARYTCVVGGWCSLGGPYEPGVGWAWMYAWNNSGSCL